MSSYVWVCLWTCMCGNVSMIKSSLNVLLWKRFQTPLTNKMESLLSYSGKILLHFFVMNVGWMMRELWYFVCN